MTMTAPDPDPEPSEWVLIPCPWCHDPCGFDERFQESPDEGYVLIGVNVGCGNVDCPINPCTFAATKEEAFEKWNRRTPPQTTGEWVLVPREPTEAMLSVETKPMVRIGQGDNSRVQEWRKCVYKAMLAAAPTPPPQPAQAMGEWRDSPERMAESLFQHIKHGDDAHRAWLWEQSLIWARTYLTLPPPPEK